MTGLELLSSTRSAFNQEATPPCVCVLHEDFQPKTGSKPKTDNPDVNQPSKPLRNTAVNFISVILKDQRKDFLLSLE